MGQAFLLRDIFCSSSHSCSQGWPTLYDHRNYTVFELKVSAALSPPQLHRVQMTPHTNSKYYSDLFCTVY